MASLKQVVAEERSRASEINIAIRQLFVGGIPFLWYF